MRLRASTFHVLDAETNKCLCHLSDPTLLPQLRRELGRPLKLVPEWQQRLDRMRLRFEKAGEPEVMERRPLNSVLASPLHLSPEISQGEFLNLKTVNFNPLRH